MKKIKLLLLLLLPLLVNAQNKFNFDYSQTIVMKIDMAIPDGKGGSKVMNTFESAMEIIKKADNLSLGVPKIYYLVGWQYNGHDDKYPAFFEVNKALKRPQDATAKESLQWLMKEAKKYNSTVSFHLNMTDAYDNSPLWQEYVDKDMISKTKSGRLMVIGNYNGKKAYQINYKHEWENGYAQMRIDKLLELIPELKDAGTLHLDAWIVRSSEGHYESHMTEAKYQKKVLDYWKEKGIDITSEWVMDYMTGYVPFAWHFNAMSQEDYLRVPANIYTGSGLNPDVRNTDFGLGFLFGKSMYGEPVFPTFTNKKSLDGWEKKFTEKFFLNVLQYTYLNKLKRLKVEGEGDNRIAFFSNDVQTSLKDSTVTQNGFKLREKNYVIFPMVWKNEISLAAYSHDKDISKIKLPESWSNVQKASIYEVTPKGNKLIKVVTVKRNSLSFKLKKKTPYYIKPKVFK